MHCELFVPEIRLSGWRNIYTYCIYIIFFNFADVMVGFAQAEYTVEETDGFVMVCLVLTGVIEPTETEIWLDVSAMDDSAVGRYQSGRYHLSLCRINRAVQGGGSNAT